MNWVWGVKEKIAKGNSRDLQGFFIFVGLETRVIKVLASQIGKTGRSGFPISKVSEG